MNQIKPIEFKFKQKKIKKVSAPRFKQMNQKYAVKTHSNNMIGNMQSVDNRFK